MSRLARFRQKLRQYYSKNPQAAKQGLKVILLYIGMYTLLALLLSYFQITTEDVQAYFAQYGAFSVLIFLVAILLVALTPLPDTPIVAGGVLIVGVPVGFLVIWGGLVLAAMINFFIARRLGRKFIEKAYPESVHYIDTLTQNAGFETFVVGRLVTFVSFDLISYVAGLTSISTPLFLLAAILGVLPVAINYVIIGTAISAQDPYIAVLSFILALAVAASFSGIARLWRRNLKRRKDRTHNTN
jgi:uncharacterized membrane protein YdjX (TVP38/TMEM64 family)